MFAVTAVSQRYTGCDNPNLKGKAFVISCSDAYPMFTAKAISIEI